MQIKICASWSFHSSESQIPYFLAIETEPRCVSHAKEIWFYFKCQRKQPEDFNQRYDMIWFLLYRKMTLVAMYRTDRKEASYRFCGHSKRWWWFGLGWWQRRQTEINWFNIHTADLDIWGGGKKRIKNES